MDKYKKLMYGSLLHDIGKLVQRAKIDRGTHSEQGWKYIKDIVKDEEIASCIRYHHGREMSHAKLANDSIAYIVYEADNISAGIDRRVNDEGEEGFNPNMPLESIFNLFKPDGASEKKSLQLMTLKDEDKINFPLNPKNISVNDMKYKYIFDDFDSAFKRMNFENDSIESLLKLIERTQCYIPSSTNQNEAADISLYNHSKITAMIAGCMYKYFEEKNLNDYKKLCFDNPDHDEKMYLLVSGELSGIQKFLYTISSKGALKTLRGRSFYLEMLVEHVVDEILSELGLSRTNLHYSGGGHFYLLIQNTEKARKILKEAKSRINDWLIREYSAELYFELSFAEASSNFLANDLKKKEKDNDRLGELFRTVSISNSKNKLRRYSKEQLEFLTAPRTLKDYSRECTICGTSSGNLSEFRESLVCDNCKGMYMLGESLPKINSNVVVVAEVTASNAEGVAVPSISENKLNMKIDKTDSAIKLLEKGEKIKIYSINNPLTGSSYFKDIWAGTYMADNETGNLIEFEELANRSKGIKRLGVLRADVDNLGTAFINGFEHSGVSRYQYVSLSRNADLSYNLSMFFKHDINKICEGKSGLPQFSLLGEEKQAGKRNAVIVYSGGDDLFIVGAWNEVLELAVDINNAFKKFTNNKMTISAGIGIFKHDFPINQMAGISGDMEDVAKKAGKDRIVLFGKDSGNYNHIYTWNEFTDNVVADKLLKLNSWFELDEKRRSSNKLNLGRSMLYKLMSMMKSIAEGKDDKIDIARMAYTIARLEPEDKNLMDLYRDFKKAMYSWIFNEKDLNEAITAIMILVYLNREVE